MAPQSPPAAPGGNSSGTPLAHCHTFAPLRLIRTCRSWWTVARRTPSAQRSKIAAGVGQLQPEEILVLVGLPERERRPPPAGVKPQTIDDERQVGGAGALIGLPLSSGSSAPGSLKFASLRSAERKTSFPRSRAFILAQGSDFRGPDALPCRPGQRRRRLRQRAPPASRPSSDQTTTVAGSGTTAVPRSRDALL